MAAIGLLALARCAAPLPGTSAPEMAAKAPDPHIGRNFWVSPYSSLNFCVKPVGSSRVTDCREIKSGRFTVLAPVYGREFHALTGYQIRLANGQEGYVSDIDLILAKSAREHARSVAAVVACKRKGGVRIGMTRQQVYASCWGRPQQTNVTITAGGKREQLVYGIGAYVYLTDGIVTGIQASR